LYFNPTPLELPCPPEGQASKRLFGEMVPGSVLWTRSHETEQPAEMHVSRPAGGQWLAERRGATHDVFDMPVEDEEYSSEEEEWAENCRRDKALDQAAPPCREDTTRTIYKALCTQCTNYKTIPVS
jgi:hypothetical protein